ncbi:hypothetical protein [Candidatus Entotheonella palauensis]|uniref:hypothetical protein n=1 Tax=Candidatus Entotheonella palauensis TaxID=93172 RepID=UPI000B7D171A|nr:hypothetical protein [Candidatus Entotheonella palauensis]
MSVLSFPRIHFNGIYLWDPGLTNNFSQLYDSVDVRILLPDGVTYESFKDFVIDNQLGSWNYYGTHDCQFKSSRTTITGGVLNADRGLTSDDPIVGKSVRLNGKLVDLDPAANWNSQIFFDSFRFGDSTIGLRARRSHRMHSRWIGPRAAFQLPIAGGFGVVWQTVFAKEDVRFFGATQSPLIAALQEAMEADGADGVMLRFSTYRTLYFQGDGEEDIEHDPDGSVINQLVAELHQRYQNGENISNPAYSVAVGTVGLWRSGETPSVPEGRYLATQVPVDIAGVGAFPLGPCVAEVDSERQRLTVDLCHTIPEINFERDKADLGTLRLAIEYAGDTIEIATIGPVEYGRDAYEATAGMIDLNLESHADPQIIEKIEAGRLVLLVNQSGRDVVALRENDLTVQASLRDIYLDEDLSRAIQLTVLDKGRPAQPGTRILTAGYDRNRRLIPAPMSSPEILMVEEAGKATLRLSPDAPGFFNIQFYPFRRDEPMPRPGAQLNISTGFFVSVRVLPFDNEFEALTRDEQLSFRFIYDHILRPYDLLNPVMARPGIDLPLSDRDLMTRLPTIIRIREAIAASQFESARYMPVTRALSAGKRRLLDRWCHLVEQGRLPADPDDEPSPANLRHLVIAPVDRMRREA